MRPSKLYPFVIPANGTINLLVSGDYWKIKTATGSVTVTGDSFGVLGGILPGQGLRDTDFTRLTLTDETGAINTGSILISDGTFVDDRVTGEVSVIDGGKQRTIAGNVGMSTSQVAGVAAQYTRAGIWNPAASGKRIVIKRIMASTSQAQDVYFCRINAALSTLATPGSILLDGNNFSGVTKSTAETNAAAATNVLFVSTLQTAVLTTILLDEPFIVKSGQGLIIHCNTLNTNLTLAIPFFEELDQ